MLKKSLGIAILGTILSFSTNSFAETTESDISGNNDVITILASDNIYRTEYETEYYEDTCSRQVYDGTTTSCTPNYENRCVKIPGVGVECHQEETSSSCTSEPTYRTETYSCTNSRTVAVQVFDHTVNAKILVSKAASAKDFDLSNCKLGVQSLSDSNESYYALCEGALVRAKVIKRSQVKVGRDVERTVQLELNFASVEGLSGVKNGLSGINYSKGVISFKTANLAAASNFALSMSITRNRFLLKDKVLFNSNLKSSDYTLQKLEDGRVKVLVNLSKIGAGIDASKKHTIRVSLSTVKAVDLKDVLNRPSFSNKHSDSIVVNE